MDGVAWFSLKEKVTNDFALVIFEGKHTIDVNINQLTDHMSWVAQQGMVKLH